MKVIKPHVPYMKYWLEFSNAGKNIHNFACHKYVPCCTVLVIRVKKKYLLTSYIPYL